MFHNRFEDDYYIQDEISEHISALIDTIKKCYTGEITHLKKRIAELQDFAKKKDEYDRKIEQLELKLEEERKNSVKKNEVIEVIRVY